MSWMKRRGQPSPNPTSNSGVPMYNPNQHSNPQQSYQQQQWPQQQATQQQYNTDWYNQPKAPSKTPPIQQYQPPQHQQATTNNYWPQQSFNAQPPAANQFQQYNNQFPANPPQQYYQPPQNIPQQAYTTAQAANYFPQQNNSPSLVNPLQQQSETDPWNWDLDDNTNANAQPPKDPNITDSFANDETWNWSVEDNNSASQKMKREEITPHVAESEHLQAASDTLEDLPSLLSLRRIKNENLTPQWSIESQVSQDSSEDVLLTSESDNRSNVLSQSSTTSQSPHEFLPQNFRYEPQPEINPEQERSAPVEEPLNSKYYQDNSQNIERQMDDLNLNAQFENKEILTPDVSENSKTNQEDMKEASPPIGPPPKKINHQDSVKNPYKNSTSLSHKTMNKTLIPTTTSQSNIDPIFLQNAAPSAFTQPTKPQKEPPILPTTTELGANLETVPDNSERPDQLPGAEPLQKPVRKTSSVTQQWSENCEIAPINDRNQYLETGQLSDADLPVFSQTGDDYRLENAQASSSGDVADSLPPPGLCRLVLGQMEQPEPGQSSDNALDEPPPGLSRMVLGSTAVELKKSKALPFVTLQGDMANVFNPGSFQNHEEPPAGLHRMIPGESSSPESSSYSAVFQAVNFDDGDNYVSESELNQLGVNLVAQRSATIGADTPPVTTQQILSNASYSNTSIDQSSAIPSREGAVGIDKDQQDPGSTSGNPPEENLSSSDTNRREDIDGEPQEEILTSQAVRDQTVGQNTTDVTSSGSNQADKHRNRNYTTDSEHEQPKERHNRSSSPPARYDKDRRYYEDRRERQRDKDSPDRFRGDRKFDKRRPKDRRYEEDTDYYSDKERNERRQHRDEREEYERRYNSLRRDKDRDRRRDRPERREYERDDRRNDYYYNNSRYEDDYFNRSRPSSRSDSMHDSYRDRTLRHADRDLDRSRHRPERERDPRRPRDPRDPYNSYYQGYNYDPYSNYYQQYQYYENLRRTNPQAYMEWYRKYYQGQAGATPHNMGYSTEDRASVHSGRSSANEELNKDRLLDNTDSSLILDDTNATSQRLTPAKFSTAHVKASISSGNFLNILPHYPLDGQPATLEIISLQSLVIDDEEQKELSEYPGPLMKGVSHKKTIIEFCENKIKKANNNHNIQDVESYILMWELLILLLRQNGMVVGTDIAELLMKNRNFETSRRQSLSSNSSTQQLDTVENLEHRVSPAMHYKEDFITDKFREFLIYGSGKEALEWAMKHGLWGHALFLASKLDKRTYANVMMRFANGLTMNDPLQTLYQLLSGRQPAAVTSVVDEKWGDWRPHLAMILSNTSQRPDLDRKAITTLGDTLLQRGSLYAAHFCYLMAQVEFGKYGSSNSKLVLLSSSHSKPFKTFATNEAIFMTEIYEYACSLSDNSFTIPEFQSYKYLLATRLISFGLLEKGLQYLERISIDIKLDPSRAQPSLVERVCELADRLKYCDPVQDDTDLDNSRGDVGWLSDLKSVLSDYSMGLITHESSTNLTSLEPEFQPDFKPSQIDQQQQQQVPEQQWQQQEYYQQPNEQPLQQSLDYNNQQPVYQESAEMQQQNFDATYQQPEQFWPNQQQQWDENNDPSQQIDETQQQNEYWSNSAQSEDAPIQQISMPNQSKAKNFFEAEDAEHSGQKPASSSKLKSSSQPAKPSSTGWFGGIWSKLALRPKNQMKLPDDKNPTIVWDSEKKRWVNLEEDNTEVSPELKPPPKMAEMFSNHPSTNYPPLMPPQNTTNVTEQPLNENPTDPDSKKPPIGQRNMFKMQRNRNIKNAYVDVFNPSGAKQPVNKGSIPAPEVFSAAPTNGNYFVPPVNSDPNAPTDFLTPQVEDPTQVGGAPLMYNPNQFQNSGSYATH